MCMYVRLRHHSWDVEREMGEKVFQSAELLKSTQSQLHNYFQSIGLARNRARKKLSSACLLLVIAM